MNDEPIRRWEGWTLVALAALFLVIRIPLFTRPGLLLGWNSDAALIGLISRAMYEGWDYPIFFWGQFYLGTLTSMLTAGLAALLRVDAIGPLLLRATTSIVVVIAFLFFWSALRRVFGRGAAMLALFWLVAGPSFLFHFTIAPLAVEQLLLVTGILLWHLTRMDPGRATQWLLPGLVIGIGMWLHQGVIFLCAGIAVAMAIKRVWPSWKSLAFLTLAALIGYIPAIVSLLRDDPLLYVRTTASWSIPHVMENVAATFRGDLWLLLADASRTGIAVALIVIAFAVVGFLHAPRSLPLLAIVWTIVISLAFWILSMYPYPGAVRYIAPVVPLIYGAAAFGMLRMRRIVLVIAAIVVTAGLYLPRIAQARDVAAGRSERYTNWPGFFDPRPTLAEIQQGGYRVCYGEVWVAHKLEWLSEPTVRFVVVRSVHRTLPQSLTLIREPGDKCFVDNDGHVRRLSAAEEAYWASTVRLRARKAGFSVLSFPPP